MHPPGGCDCPAPWPACRLSGRDGSRRSDRPAGHARRHLGMVLAVLPRDLLRRGYAAVVLSFRFAAADGVAPKRRARALSFVMAGGVAAGVVGPQLVTWTMDWWPPHMFAATFLVQAAVAALSALILLGVRSPTPT